MAEIRRFSYCFGGGTNYFKFIFEKALDFFLVPVHTKRAFKLGTN